MSDQLQEKLNEVIEKYVAFMFERLVSVEGENTDYDILSATISEDGWHLLLEARRLPGRMFEFEHKTGVNRVTVSTYVKAHQFHTEL